VTSFFGKAVGQVRTPAKSNQLGQSQAIGSFPCVVSHKPWIQYAPRLILQNVLS